MSDDSYDQEEDFQTNIDQRFEKFDEEEPVPSDSVFNVSDSNPDFLDPAFLDNHKLLNMRCWLFYCSKYFLCK